MPPRLPDRYHFEVRLGRDGDVEEWLATDRALDRPVLIRLLGPETGQERRGEFLDAVRGAAGVTHTHLASIYAAAELPDGAYSVSEWAGGMTLAHRRAAGETLPVHEFLPNAAGLAEALAALHAEGVLHGGIGEGSIFFSMAHPAKLAGFGGHVPGASAAEDVRDLADTLIMAVTGSSVQSVAPSQMVDGLSPAVDGVLRRAQAGDLDAAGLAELLRAAPSTRQETIPERAWSWKWVTPVLGLLAVAIVLFFIGRSLDTGEQDPLLFPVAPGPSTTVTTSSSPSTTGPAPPAPDAGVSVTAIRVFDPEGDGAEHDGEIPNLTDGDTATAWTTERYNDPLPLIKSGVGFTVAIEGTPGRVDLLGAVDGMSFRLYWSESANPTLSGWEGLAGGSTRGDSGSLQLPPRNGGFWLIWLTDVPADPEGGYVGSIGEVRFRP